MIQLFKAKSLKKTQKTKQGANSKNAKKQRGRSMVEMLGVLAIIGVLSIGGIQGYTLAMRKYRANEILNIVQKYAMVLYSSCQQSMEKNPQNYGVMSKNTHYSDRVEPNSWYCPGIKFTDAGLGALPSGVKQIGWLNSNNNPMVEPGHFDSTFVGVSIKSLSSGDAVVIHVGFDTKELCESAMGIIGKPEKGGLGSAWNNDDMTCGNNHSDFGIHDTYYLAVSTMMN